MTSSAISSMAIHEEFATLVSWSSNHEKKLTNVIDQLLECDNVPSNLADALIDNRDDVNSVREKVLVIEDQVRDMDKAHHVEIKKRKKAEKEAKGLRKELSETSQLPPILHAGERPNFDGFNNNTTNSLSETHLKDTYELVSEIKRLKVELSTMKENTGAMKIVDRSIPLSTKEKESLSAAPLSVKIEELKTKVASLEQDKLELQGDLEAIGKTMEFQVQEEVQQERSQMEELLAAVELDCKEDVTRLDKELKFAREQVKKLNQELVSLHRSKSKSKICVMM